MPQRVILYIDAQNVYRGARDCFGVGGGLAHVQGQIDPMAVARLICERAPEGEERAVSQVRVYSGRPESGKQPQAYAAHMRQCAAWERAGVTVITRTLRYFSDFPSVKPREKGVDVQLAIDFVAGAIDNRYDVGIIFSTDSDLRPALELVAQRFNGQPRAESAAWGAPRANRAIFCADPRTWCHYLTADDYRMVQDTTDYNKS